MLIVQNTVWGSQSQFSRAHRFRVQSILKLDEKEKKTERKKEKKKERKKEEKERQKENNRPFCRKFGLGL